MRFDVSPFDLPNPLQQGSGVWGRPRCCTTRLLTQSLSFRFPSRRVRSGRSCRSCHREFRLNSGQSFDFDDLPVCVIARGPGVTNR